jgi:hypothetical protein
MEGADEDEAAATLTETATGGDEYRPGPQDDEDPGAAGAFVDEQLAAGAPPCSVFNARAQAPGVCHP